MAACSGASGGCGFLAKTVDMVLLLFFCLGAVMIPLLDAQVCLAGRVGYPSFLVDLKVRYASEFGDYLVAERPHFFRGLVWVELLLLWPLSIACAYAIVSGRRWFFQTASLIAGVYTATSMAATMAELLGSGRAPERLIKVYVIIAAFALLATLRGLFPCSAYKTSPADTSDGSRQVGKKKRA